ncbi:MAG: hypothetical protein AAGE89_12835 [Pseudomonadota bacterium]
MMRLLVSLLLLVFASTAASATTYKFKLFDHGFGSQGSNYGLRADELGADLGFDPTTFSVSTNGGSLHLTVTDGPDPTAIIDGQVSRNDGGGVYDISYALSGITLLGDGAFTATGGSGTISGTPTSPTNPAPFSFDFDGKQDKNGFATIFKFDGHRLPGDSTTGVLRGWIIDTDRPCCNDFLVRVEAVPLPAPLALLLAGIAGLGFAASRRKKV